MIIKNKESNTIYKSLISLGWNEKFQQYYDKNCDPAFSPARVVGVYKNYFLVNDGKKEILATTSGNLKKKTNLFPVIGDWITLSETVIYDVLPRENTLYRGAAGTHGKQEFLPNKEQIMAANLDTIFIVSGTDRDFNVRRIERYLTLVYNCGLNPVIILTKADLHQESEKFVTQIEEVTFGVPVHLISANDSHGLKALENYISKGKTISLIGSSGAGKSTLVNRLYGKEIQKTKTINDTIGKGRHTTTNRSLIQMPQGGMIIDNPGIREIGLWDDGGGLDTTFPEIEKLAKTCRFNDCTHSHEPGCNVIQAITTGTLDQERLDSYRKMQRELNYLSQRSKKSADRLEKERWKDVAVKIKHINKIKGY